MQLYRGPEISGLVLLALMLVAASCGNEYVFDETPTTPDTSQTNAKVLGTCFMDGEDCVSTYIDLGPYEDHPPLEKEAVPVYVFPSVAETDGGLPNPFDPLGLYNPYRLQNNVFAGDGRVWGIWLVYSDNLNLMAAPRPGVTLWGVGADPEGDRRRDLFLNPITGEAEILALVDAGDIRIEDTGSATDCPITPPRRGDIVVNLNPRFSLCPH
ncbi:MAG: hypothetical protein R3282_00535 [Rhodothermales bacterium]|nr:hypothetical protein [Rhodothermales bacterium]